MPDNDNYLEFLFCGTGRQARQKAAFRQVGPGLGGALKNYQGRALRAGLAGFGWAGVKSGG